MTNSHDHESVLDARRYLAFGKLASGSHGVRVRRKASLGLREISLSRCARGYEKNGGFHGRTLHLFVVFFRSSHNANLHATDGLDAEAAKLRHGLDAEAAKLRHGRHDAC